MPVPWEALIPFGLLAGMFGLSGTLMRATRTKSNDGMAPRYGIDSWDDMMMERDRRLTGRLRGQSTDPVAPEQFSTNSEWTATKLRGR